MAKYKKGSSQVDGNTEFQFHAGNLNFKSSSHDAMSLVIAGAKAIYKGIGTVNNISGYSFMLSAIDGNKKTTITPDAFRIKIWKTNSEILIYDNQLTQPDNVDASTTLGGGSIVIHEVKGGKQSSTTALSESNGGLDLKLVEPLIDPKTKLVVFPNPFGKQATVTFTLPVDEQRVVLDVFSVNGSRIKRLYDGKANANQSLQFNFDGSFLSPGIYLVRLITSKSLQNLKIIMNE